MVFTFYWWNKTFVEKCWNKTFVNKWWNKTFVNKWRNKTLLISDETRQQCVGLAWGILHSERLASLGAQFEALLFQCAVMFEWFLLCPIIPRDSRLSVGCTVGHCSYSLGLIPFNKKISRISYLGYFSDFLRIFWNASKKMS